MKQQNLTVTESILDNISRVESDITPFPRLGFLKPKLLVVLAFLLAGLCIFLGIASGMSSEKRQEYRPQQQLDYPWGRR